MMPSFSFSANPPPLEKEKHTIEDEEYDEDDMDEEYDVDDEEEQFLELFQFGGRAWIFGDCSNSNKGHGLSGTTRRTRRSNFWNCSNSEEGCGFGFNFWDCSNWEHGFLGTTRTRTRKKG